MHSRQTAKTTAFTIAPMMRCGIHAPTDGPRKSWSLRFVDCRRGREAGSRMRLPYCVCDPRSVSRRPRFAGLEWRGTAPAKPPSDGPDNRDGEHRDQDECYNANRESQNRVLQRGVTETHGEDVLTDA